MPTGSGDDVAGFCCFSELALCFFLLLVAEGCSAVGVVAQCESSVCLAHLVVGGCLGYAEGAIGFLQCDVDVGLPCAVFFSVVAVVCLALIGEVYGGAAIHGIEEPAKQEAEDESATSGHTPTDEGKDETETD